MRLRGSSSCFVYIMSFYYWKDLYLRNHLDSPGRAPRKFDMQVWSVLKNRPLTDEIQPLHHLESHFTTHQDGAYYLAPAIKPRDDSRDALPQALGALPGAQIPDSEADPNHQPIDPVSHRPLDAAESDCSS